MPQLKKESQYIVKNEKNQDLQIDFFLKPLLDYYFH